MASMMRATLFFGASIAMLSVVALADEMPARKPGLWEITLSEPGSPPDISRLCLDVPTEADLLAKANATMKQICSQYKLQRNGDVITEDSVCKPMKSQTTMHAVTTLRGDSAYTRVSNSHYDPPFMGRTDAQMTQEGIWLGPCGPDMKPGDFVKHGQKMNIGGKS
jgi:hypothetical protein